MEAARTIHEKWFAGETISVGIGQGAVTVTPIQLARYISGIASDGHFVRPHVVDPAQLPAEFRQALCDAFPGSGVATVPMIHDTWMTITQGMAGATDPGHGRHGDGRALEGVDFAGKTGTAQVVGGGDTHVKGGRRRKPNAWFVGMVPRRDPEFAVVIALGAWRLGIELGPPRPAMVVTFT